MNSMNIILSLNTCVLAGKWWLTLITKICCWNMLKCPFFTFPAVARAFSFGTLAGLSPKSSGDEHRRSSIRLNTPKTASLWSTGLQALCLVGVRRSKDKVKSGFQVCFIPVTPSNVVIGDSAGCSGSPLFSARYHMSSMENAWAPKKVTWAWAGKDSGSKWLWSQPISWVKLMKHPFSRSQTRKHQSPKIEVWKNKKLQQVTL